MWWFGKRGKKGMNEALSVETQLCELRNAIRAQNRILHGLQLEGKVPVRPPLTHDEMFAALEDMAARISDAAAAQHQYELTLKQRDGVLSEMAATARRIDGLGLHRIGPAVTKLRLTITKLEERMDALELARLTNET